DFDDRPIWRPGMEPDAAETARRVAAFHAPYHAALAAEVERVRPINGVAIGYDCHSIRTRCPFLLEGLRPDCHLGTDGGRTCDAAVERAVANTAANAACYKTVVNGRFRGGWTTRHYGRPQAGVHAIQMELAQVTHLAAEEPPFAYDEAKAERLRAVLK